MLDIVSFETAKKLKEAGFPQPEYIALGFGYTDNGTRFYIEECRFPMGGVNGMYFAPTATDILREMYGFQIGLNDEKQWEVVTAMMWEEGEDGSDCYSGGMVYGTHEHPAEAAALAWLSINATTFEMKITGNLNA